MTGEFVHSWEGRNVCWILRRPDGVHTLDIIQLFPQRIDRSHILNSVSYFPSKLKAKQRLSLYPAKKTDRTSAGIFKTMAGIRKKLSHKIEFHIGEEPIVWDKVIMPNGDCDNFA